MPTDQAELNERTQLALEAIRRSLGTEGGEYNATLFASHHLEELKPSYWKAHLDTDKPTPAQVLGLLCLQSHRDESGDDDAGVDVLDFSLPGDITNYVLCVKFDESGAVADIAMES